MRHLTIVAAASAISLTLATAASAAPKASASATAQAEPAKAEPAMAQPAAVQPSMAAPTAGAATSMRRMSARDLMTPEERASFRAQMQAATPADRQALWDQKRAELEQRATQRGMALAEAGQRLSSTGKEMATAASGRDMNRGEHGPGRAMSMMEPPHGM